MYLRDAGAMTARRLQLCGAAAAVTGGVSLLTPAGDVSAICNATAVPDLALLGSGRCVDGAKATAWAFACTTADALCASAVSADACALTCFADPGCTGFELTSVARSAAANGTTVVECAVFVAAAPAFLPGDWTAVAGAQMPGGRVVVSANATQGPTSCCYKRACVVGCRRRTPSPA